MERILTFEQSKYLDKIAINSGIDSLTLMEEAGFSCYKIIKERITPDSHILIVCGSGGNGGDGAVIGRYFFEDGFDTYIYLIGEHLKEDTKINLARYNGKFIKGLNDLAIDGNLVIIDAILGVGDLMSLKRNYIDLIDTLNQMNGFKVSIDINSGINTNTGFALESHFKSDLTIAINNFKLGHFFNDGIDAYKELVKVDISIDDSIIKNPFLCADKNDFKTLFLKRSKDSNKGTYGRVALIGGSKLTPGAINLSLNALASLRCGVGYTLIAIPNSLYGLYALKNSENIYMTLSDNDGNVLFNKNEISKLLNYNTIGIGMGIGVSEEVYKIISYLLKNYEGTLLIDADGLNSISKFGVDILKKHRCKLVITPHLKEFERLTGININDIKKDYIGYATKFAREYNLIINLKNDISVITDGRSAYLNINGNPGLAKGGSGDVLSGITCALLTNSNNLLLSTACAAYLLGKSADLAINDINEYSLIANDLSEYLIKAINEIS